jgi:hypothetical protein
MTVAPHNGAFESLSKTAPFTVSVMFWDNETLQIRTNNIRNMIVRK